MQRRLTSRLALSFVSLCLISLPVQALPEGATRFVRGDTDGNGRVDITDPLAVLHHLFVGDVDLDCEDAADVDDNGRVQLSDAVWLMEFLFLGGSAPAAPFPACAADPTTDPFDCEQFPPCRSRPAQSLQLLLLDPASSLLLNGSFEVPESPASILPGEEPDGFGWKVLRGDVEVRDNTTSVLSPTFLAFEQKQFLDLDGVSSGAIEQTFPTMPGKVYILAFAYSNNPRDDLGATVPASATVVVEDAATAEKSIQETIEHGSATVEEPDWRRFEMRFIALGDSTTLRFDSLSAESSNGGIGLDAVIVAPRPPSNLVVGKVDTSRVAGNWQALKISGTVTAEVANVGAADVTRSFSIVFFEDRNFNSILDDDTDRVLGLTTTGALEAGESRSVAAPVFGGVLFRENLIHAFVDSQDEIPETSEDDNYSHSGVACALAPRIEAEEPDEFASGHGRNLRSNPTRSTC